MTQITLDALMDIIEFHLAHNQVQHAAIILHAVHFATRQHRLTDDEQAWWKALAERVETVDDASEGR